jgi:hypothetical protein
MSTDVQTKNLGVVVVRYYDDVMGSIVSKLWRIMEFTAADHLSLFQKIDDLILSCKIPYENLIGFGSDGAKNLLQPEFDSNSLSSLLLTRQPRLFIIRCLCHSINLVSSHATETLPPNAEQLLRDVYNYFAYSYKSTAVLKEVQGEFSLSKHKIVSYNKVRWLSLKNSVNRVLEQWESLKEVFNRDGEMLYFEFLNRELKLYLISSTTSTRNHAKYIKST